MLTPEHKETLMTLAGDLISMADKDIEFLNNINTEEWRLFGCYAVWLL
jgi:hypothetical protein